MATITKVICDQCGQEITEKNNLDVNPAYTTDAISVNICHTKFRIQKYGEGASAGNADICAQCIIKEFADKFNVHLP